MAAAVVSQLLFSPWMLWSLSSWSRCYCCQRCQAAVDTSNYCRHRNEKLTSHGFLRLVQVDIVVQPNVKLIELPSLSSKLTSCLKVSLRNSKKKWITSLEGVWRHERRTGNGDGGTEQDDMAVIIEALSLTGRCLRQGAVFVKVLSSSSCCCHRGAVVVIGIIMQHAAAVVKLCCCRQTHESLEKD